MFEIIPSTQYSRAVRRGGRGENRVFSPFFGLSDFEREFFPQGINELKTDIRDNGESFTLEADLPGFKKEDINIDIDADNLVISAERKTQTEEKDKNGYVRRERTWGSFKRSFDISGIDAAEITASYTDGVLKLELPKKKEDRAAGRRLEIK